MSVLTSRRSALSLFAAAALALLGLPPSPTSAAPEVPASAATPATTIVTALGQPVLASLGAPAAPKPTEVSAPERARITESFGKLPLYFIENQGQMDGQVSHYLQGRDKSIYFTPQGVTFVLYAPTAMLNKKHERLTGDAPPIERQPIERHVVKLDFLNANPDIKPRGHNKTDAIISYFKGKPSDQHTAIPTWLGVTYANLWDGIDLAYDSAESSLKYTFTVTPHADPDLIQLAYRGADSVTLTDAGSLTVTTPAGSLYDGSPIAWQDIAGQRIAVPVSFTLEAATHTISFALGDYDKSHPLTLDPAYLVYAGYIGGSGGDVGYGIAVDASGNAYVTGYTNSTAVTFPETVGPDLTHNGGYDAFVAKVNSTGTALVYAGYIGGSGDDIGYGIAVDAGGNAYVSGHTSSTEATFPVTVGPDLTHNGNYDAFVAKVNATGTVLVYAGYIGGSGTDIGHGIAVDAGGNAYVTGYTGSTEATFPVTGGPDLTYNGSTDAFVAKVNSTGTALVYAGYIGGSGIDNGFGIIGHDGRDYGHGIAVDASGNAYVAGRTHSTEASFPETGGPDLTHNGNYDAFVAKVNPAGTALVYAGYIGGSDYDDGYGIAVDAGGNAYVTGGANSPEANFPVSGGPDLTSNGNSDAFVAKVNPAGTVLVYAGYIGGSGTDIGYGIAVDAAGNAYVSGHTASTEATFPETVGPDLTHNGGAWDAFVAKVNSTGTALSYAGYIGGSDRDFGYGIAVDASGNAYVTGETPSSETSFPVTGGPDLTFNGGLDAFVAKIAPPDTTPDAFSFTAQTGVARSTLTTSNTITVSGINTASPISIVGGTYMINAVAYTAVAGTVINGDTVTLRQTSSASFETLTTATLDIGGVSGAFDVTTLAEDRIPDAFIFTAQTGVALSTVTTSNTITVGGINTTTGISIGGGTYSINGGTYTNVASFSVNNGDTVTLRQTSSASFSTQTTATLTIGGVSGAFDVTTLAADTTPPTVPTGLTASAVSATRVNLSWTASTDNIGVTGYKVYRDGVQVGTPAGTNFIDTGLAGATPYSYTVAACDAAANCSDPSVVTSATTLAVAMPGTVVAWGSNAQGQTTIPAGLSGVTAITAGEGHTVALKNDGTVLAWGWNANGQTTIPAGLSGVTAIAAGYEHTVALKNDGTVVAWGYSGSSQTTIPAGLSGVTAIAAGYLHTVALKNDGTVVAWGWNEYGQTTIPAGLSGVVAIAVGGNHTVALKNDGTVLAWGAGWDGQTTVPSGLSGVTAIAAGNSHTVALKNDGTVVAWGHNGSGQTTIPAGLSGVTAISAGRAHTVALKNDGTVVAWGYNLYGQTTIPAGLSGVTAIAAGGLHTVALGNLGLFTAPTSPTGLTASAISATQVDLSWTASTHSIAVTGYRVYRGGTLFATLGNVLSFSNTGLTAATLYNYTVAACNAATNCSAQSTAVSVTTLPPPDTTPDAFSFTAQTGVARSTLTTSNTITVSGINTASPISIVGGTYSIDGGTYTSATGTVNNGDTVMLQQTSSGSFSTLTTATLDIGGVSGAFDVTTLAEDTTPNAFSFIAQTNVALSTLTTSNIITVSGINTASPISIAVGGTYSIDGGTYTSATGTVNNGDTVMLQQTSSGSFSTLTTATLDIGGVDGAFDVTTTLVVAPAAPTALTAWAASSSSIVLDWLDNSSNETGFRIEGKPGVCTAANPWVQIAAVGANVITHTNISLTANAAYSYRVRAYNTAGNSAYSNCASARTGLAGTPNSPTGLMATSVSAGQINLAWADSSTNETSFRLFRRNGTGSWILLFTTAANAVSYAHTAASGNTSTTTYSYYMQACNSAGCSPATTVAVVPYRPTSPTATASSTQINLTWTDTSANETGFQIHRKAGNCASVNPWSLLATKAANSTSHSNTGLTSGTTYAYRIRSYTRSIAVPYTHGFSLWSTCVSATTP